MGRSTRAIGWGRVRANEPGRFAGTDGPVRASARTRALEAGLGVVPVTGRPGALAGHLQIAAPAVAHDVDGAIALVAAIRPSVGLAVDAPVPDGPAHAVAAGRRSADPARPARCPARCALPPADRPGHGRERVHGARADAAKARRLGLTTVWRPVDHRLAHTLPLRRVRGVPGGAPAPPTPARQRARSAPVSVTSVRPAAPSPRS